jgi:TRAP-type C4-dicarboxylate transport system substrate-binding protein
MDSDKVFSLRLEALVFNVVHWETLPLARRRIILPALRLARNKHWSNWSKNTKGEGDEVSKNSIKILACLRNPSLLEGKVLHKVAREGSARNILIGNSHAKRLKC